MHRGRALTTPVLILGVTALYVMAGLLGMRLAFLHPRVTAVRPAIGIALAAGLLLGARVWPGVFLGTFLVRILTLGAVTPALGIACGNTLTVLLGAHLVRRLANGCHAVDRAPDIFRFTGTLTLAGQGTAREVRLEVRDTGNGIPAGRLQQIFEPLYTTKPMGTGLGLSIAQEIVRAHGGQLTVQSTEGQGTTLIITLSRDVADAPTQISLPA